MPSPRPRRSAAATSATEPAPRAPAGEDPNALQGGAAAEAAPSPARLRPTETPGVFYNDRGALVDENGVLLAFKAVRDRYARHAVDVVGEVPGTPAEVLRMFSLDPTLPASVRVDAAAKAAPYYDRKQPTAIDGGADPANPGGPGLPVRVERVGLQDLTDAELDTMDALLQRGAQGGSAAAH